MTRRRFTGLLLFAVLASTGMSAAQETVGQPAGALPAVDVSFAAGQLGAQPRIDGVATSVVVSCADGTYLHDTFEGGGAALVDLVREDGSPVADGRCKYEIVIHPPMDGEAMRAARENGDEAALERLSRRAAERTVRTVGRFTIEGGTASPGWSRAGKGANR